VPPSTTQNCGIHARIAAIATHLPERVLDNATLAAEFAGWSAEKILDKTGIAERRIAADGETALDLGEAAARKLLAGSVGHEVDFLIFCSQARDYILPTSACLLQHRLGLPTSVGALDIDLGCSGFVYGLSLATGLIAAGLARGVLLVTADTYSKYIHPRDKSVRTLFGDGAAATLIVAQPEDRSTARIGPFVFGTDGGGGDSLIVEAGGFRLPSSAETACEVEDRSGNVRSRDHLYMDGAAVLTFSLREVPRAYQQLLQKMDAGPDEVDLVVLHQANKFMMDALQRKLDVPDEKLPRLYELIGNTVSSTIPFVLASLLEEGRLTPGTRTVLIGFGVGLSWAAAAVTF